MYPFGFGLSYTEFEYDGMSVDGDTVRFTVKTPDALPGGRSRSFTWRRTGGMFRPAKELKGFARVYLEPGEQREVCITLDERSFAVGA